MSNKLIITALICLISVNAHALRVQQPPILNEPLKEDQISTLNKYLKDVWDLLNGRYEFDITTSPKTSAKNGEMWVYNNVGAGTYQLQFRAGNAVRTVSGGGSSTPGGTSGQLQYNNSSAFDGVSGSGVTAAGNVGIGSVNPVQKLDVGGSVKATAFLGNATTSTALAANGTNCSSGSYPLGVDASGNSESCTVAPSGNVGIGTANWVTYYQSSGNTVVANDNIQLVANNVGINSAAPSDALSVYGNIKLPMADTSLNQGLLKFGNMYMYSYQHPSASIGDNLFITSSGPNPLSMTSTSEYNIAVGRSVMTGLSSGYSNIAVGLSALQNNSTGYKNIALGTRALQTGTDNYNNVAIGYENASSLSGGYDNVIIGGGASVLSAGKIGTTMLGAYSVAGGSTATSIGYYSGYNVGDSEETTCLGSYSCSSVTGSSLTGDYNTFLGSSSEFISTSVSGSTAIGTRARINDNNAMVLGGTTSWKVNVGIGTWSPIATLDVSKNATMPYLALRSAGGVGADVMIVTSAGNVGISTTIPRQTLEVKGTFAVRGAQTSPFTVKAAANQACNTTCNTSMCAFGQDTVGLIMLACSDATADTCLCMGP